MWTKHSDSTQVARIGRIVTARIVDNDGEGGAGYFVRATTALETYDGPIYDRAGDAIAKTRSLPLLAKQVLRVGFDYDANEPSGAHEVTSDEARRDEGRAPIRRRNARLS
jgi:hypothetical protein